MWESRLFSLRSACSDEGRGERTVEPFAGK